MIHRRLLILMLSAGFAASCPETAWARIYQSFSDIASKAIPGVVNIRTKQFVSGRDALLDPYQFFLRGRVPRSNKNHSLGSGVIIDRKGFIVTNYHVIKGASSIDILFAKRKHKVKARIIGIDRKTDLALLKITPPFRLKPLDIGNSDWLRVGDIVLAIGNPFGFSHTVTSGIISAKGRVIGTGPYDSFLQTDASIHPGNSGGPLIDIKGRLIGINTAISSEGAGIGFAIPSNIVKTIISDLKKHGKVIRPWLGVIGKNIVSKDEMYDSHDPTGVYGVIIENLVIDGPAWKAGLRVGDLIMAMDDKKIFDINSLQKKLINKSPSERARMKVYRRQKGFVNITVPLEEIPPSQELPAEKDLF
ncbi:MAG: peptidase [Zetaproteobacteria bacterium]|nr:peptidase [Pseudobdellovibrionaceae bacterium]